MKKVLLIDTDSKIPNLALMKLSTFYKKNGFSVDLMKLNYDGYPTKKKITTINAEEYSRVLGSTIFTVNKNVTRVENCDKVTFGGTGIDITKKLPQEIDNLEEDYSLYPDNDRSYGFITRGCIRDCYFCFVPKKEGMIHSYRNPEQIIKHNKVEFLDNNILAWKDHINILKYLVENKIKYTFQQGLDLRLLNEQNAKLLSESKYLGEYIFAFDQLKDLSLMEKKLPLLKKYFPKDWRLKFFIYTHPNMNIVDDVLFRVGWCKQNKILPYVMRDVSCWSSNNSNFYVDLAAYTNQPSLFKKMTPEEYIQKRQSKNIARQNKFMKYFNQTRG